MAAINGKAGDMAREKRNMIDTRRFTVKICTVG